MVLYPRAFFGALFLALLFGAVPARADKDRPKPVDRESLSLPAALRAMVQRDPTLERATIDVAIAEANVERAQGPLDWLVTAEGTYLRTRADAVAGNIVGTNKLDRYAAEAAISKFLPTGGTVSLGTNARREDTEFTLGGGAETIQYQTGVELALSQPLLRGRGQPPTTGGLAPEQARALKDAAALTRQVVAREAVRDVVSAYWELAYAIRDREIRESSLELARQQLRDTETGIRLGRVAATEATAVEQIIATRQEEILQSEVTITERSLALRRRLGMAIHPGAVELQTSAAIKPKPSRHDMASVLKLALDASPEVLSLRARERGATIDVEVTDNGLLPRLDLTLSGGPLGTGGEFDEATQNMVELDGYRVAAGLRLEHALGRSFSRGDNKRARETRRRIRVDLRDMEAQMAQAVARASRAATIAADRITISERVVGLAEKNVEAEQRRFELGRATNFDVLQRQEELKQAQLRLTRAQVDYLNAEAALEALSGEILTRYGIKL